MTKYQTINNDLFTAEKITTWRGFGKGIFCQKLNLLGYGRTLPTETPDDFSRVFCISESALNDVAEPVFCFTGVLLHQGS